MSRLRAHLGLLTALAVGAVLVVSPSADTAKAAGPVPAAAAWPQARRGTFAATLPDGSAFQPEAFVDATTAIGTALDRDNAFLRLVVLGPGSSVRQLRRVPTSAQPSFPAVTVTGTRVSWAEGEKSGRLRLWTVDLRRGPVRQVTADTGDMRTSDSAYDLLVADGRLHWVAAAPSDATEVRSVALTGGAVERRTEPGMWQLSAWPWIVDGVTDSAGASVLRNLATGQDVTVARTGRRTTTSCSPVWCRVASIDADGEHRFDLMHPDGSARRRVGGDAAATIIWDVAPLDRFEVLSRIDATADLSGNAELLVTDLATRATIQVSPAVAKVSYGNGVLWWATGNPESFVWHSLDLRTV